MDRQFTVTPQELDAACRASLPELAVRGLEFFNQGDYFAAHEELELAWRAERGPVRELYRGILQIAVAYYHLLRGNYAGAVKTFVNSRTWLEPFYQYSREHFHGICCGIDLAAFHEDYLKVEAEVLRLGPGQISLINRGLLRPIIYTLKEKPE